MVTGATTTVQGTRIAPMPFSMTSEEIKARLASISETNGGNTTVLKGDVLLESTARFAAWISLRESATRCLCQINSVNGSASLLKTDVSHREGQIQKVTVNTTQRIWFSDYIVLTREFERRRRKSDIIQGLIYNTRDRDLCGDMNGYSIWQGT